MASDAPKRLWREAVTRLVEIVVKGSIMRHAIPSMTLRVVECSIGFLEHRPRVDDRWLQGRDPETRRDSSKRPGVRADGGPVPLGDLDRRAKRRPTAGGSRTPRRRSERQPGGCRCFGARDLGHDPDGLIARRMAKRVVVGLEGVDVDHDDRERQLLTLRDLEDRLERLQESTTIAQDRSGRQSRLARLVVPRSRSS